MSKQSPITVNRPDISDFLAHFTSNGRLKGENNNHEILGIERMTAIDRLISILRAKEIKPSKTPWREGAEAVCFTECPWTSLLQHTKQYSQYGIGFTKKAIFRKGGGPVFYIRPDHYDELKKAGIPDKLQALLTPFFPYYRPNGWDMKYTRFEEKPLDYSHEREWSVPGNFKFSYNQIEFVVLGTYKDMEDFPQDLKDAIGRDKFILMDNYRQIEKLWPVHNI